MKIRFLGTAAAEGIPALYCSCATCKKARELGGKEFRTRSQAIINDSLMLDFPPETYVHSLQNNIELSKVHNYLITHTHSDHFYPQDIEMMSGVFSNIAPGTQSYNFYGNKEMTELAAPYIKPAENIVSVNFLEPFNTYNIGGMEVTPLKANHSSAPNSYIYIIRDGDKRILYAHDTGLIDKDTEEYLYSQKPYFDLISCDCCCGTWEDKNFGTHLSFGNIKTICKKMRENGLIDDASKLCVNHFSHNGANVLYSSREVYEKEGFIMSYDGLEVEI